LQTEAVFKITFGIWAVLFLLPIGYAHRKAMREHGSRFAQAANEYPPLLWVRGLVGIPLWAFLIDWLLRRTKMPVLLTIISPNGRSRGRRSPSSDEWRPPLI
jgi:hypothetical protein